MMMRSTKNLPILEVFGLLNMAGMLTCNAVNICVNIPMIGNIKQWRDTQQVLLLNKHNPQ